MTQFDKSLADTMVKQVKTKTTLKVGGGVVDKAWADVLLLAGPLAHVPAMRRRVDVHREESVVQDGVERHGDGAADQDHCVQEWGCAGWHQEVTRLH